METKEMIYGAILTSLSLIIPIAFGGLLGVTLPPFSATLASHLPLMLSIAISPLTAFTVGLGSTIGFLIKLGPIVAARASSHILFGVLGAILYKRGMGLLKVLLLMLPIHAFAEALLVIPFGFSLYNAGVVIGVGTGIHHLIDTLITIFISTLLVKANILKIKIR